MGFSGCPGYWPLGRTNWAPVLGRCQGPGHFTELTFFLGLMSGLARLFFKPYQKPLNKCDLSSSLFVFIKGVVCFMFFFFLNKRYL